MGSKMRTAKCRFIKKFLAVETEQLKYPSESVPTSDGESKNVALTYQEISSSKMDQSNGEISENADAIVPPSVMAKPPKMLDEVTNNERQKLQINNASATNQHCNEDCKRQYANIIFMLNTLVEGQTKQGESIELLKECLSHEESIGKKTSANKEIILKMLPLTSEGELDELESLIANSIADKENLVDILHLAGGKNAHKAVYAQLQKLITPELAQKFSVVGRGNKKKPFAELEVYSAMTEAIRRRAPQTSDEEVKKSVGLFLTNSKKMIKPIVN